MNPVDYCIQKGSPPGSSNYYAIRQAKSSQRAGLTALYAFRQELVDTVLNSSDPSVAQAKLAWWEKETRSAADPASTPAAHPVLKALVASAPMLLQTRLPTLIAMITQFDADVMQARYLDYPGLRRHVNVVGGDFATLVASITVPTAQPTTSPTSTTSISSSPSASHVTPEWAHPLGNALALADLIANVGDEARHGRIYIPISEMQQFGVTAADILNRRYSEAFTQLMAFQTARARNDTAAALAAMPADARRQQVVLRAQASMAMHLLDEIESEQFQVLHQRIALTPLRKLWLAWRA